MMMLEMLKDNGDALNTRSATSPACKANAQRRREPDAVGDATARQRPEHRADAEQHPILRAGYEASAEPARDKVDKEDHVGHQTDRV